MLIALLVNGGIIRALIDPTWSDYDSGLLNAIQEFLICVEMFFFDSAFICVSSG